MNVRDLRATLMDALPSFQCPLLLDVMSDPVIIQRTGQTYERTAIERWLATHDTCPSTGVQLLGSRDLIPNFALKNSIDEWKARTDRALRALNHTVPFETIAMGELLARGRTKDVHRGVMLGKPVAVCVLKGPTEAAVLGDREADILATIGTHPNIVRFLARSEDAQGRPLVVLELAPLGKNLLQVISECHDGDVKVSERVVLQLLRQIAAGMEGLHSSGIVHRDMAARNILVFSFDPSCAEQVVVKVSDFGMSSLLGQAAAVASSAYYYGGTGAGQRELPVRWMAAEALERNKWSEKTDVFAFGVLVWEILSGGQVPWGMGLSNREVQDQVVRGEQLRCQPSWPPNLVDMIGRCCSLSPADRPTFRDLLHNLTQSQSSSASAAVNYSPTGLAHSSASEVRADATDRGYDGEWKDGKRNGRGVYTWANGDRYDGEWKDGKQNGRGVFTYGEGSQFRGDRYEGEFTNDKRNGRGVLTYGDGNRYDGEWKDGKQNGRGVYTWANGNRYDGEWKDGKMNGRGVYTWANGNRYDGEWKDGQQDCTTACSSSPRRAATAAANTSRPPDKEGCRVH